MLPVTVADANTVGHHHVFNLVLLVIRTGEADGDLVVRRDKSFQGDDIVLWLKCDGVTIAAVQCRLGER